MEMDKVVKNIEASCESMGNRSLLGIPLDSADPRLLDVKEFGLDEHVAMQPIAIAYFGNLKKMAGRRLEMTKRKHERWMKTRYSVAKAELEKESGKKATVNEIEAKIIDMNMAELSNMDAEIETLQEQFDTFESWFEAWRQKSHTLRDYATMASEELTGTGSIKNNSQIAENDEPLRAIIKKRRMQQASVTPADNMNSSTTQAQ